MENDGSRERVEAVTRIVLRPLATPIPLGFLAFGVGSFLLSGLQFGWVASDEGRNLAIILLAFVFPAEGLASILAFLAREPLGATVLGIFSFSWVAISTILLLSPPGATSGALGLFQLSLAAILIFLGPIGFLGKPVLASVITLSAFRFGLNGVYEFMTSGPLQTISAIIGIVSALICLYGGVAFILEDLQHRTVLPLWRRGEANQALKDDLTEQVGPVNTEAGVRKQL